MVIAEVCSEVVYFCCWLSLVSVTFGYHLRSSEVGWKMIMNFGVRSISIVCYDLNQPGEIIPGSTFPEW